MDNLTFSILIVTAFLMGMVFYSKLLEVTISRKDKKRIDEKKSLFISIFNSINNGNSYFKSRVLQTAYITTNTTKTGKIDVLYLIDKDDIAILKNNKVIHTSDEVDRVIIRSIIDAIREKHNSDINNTVNFFGMTFSKKDIGTYFKMDIDDFNQIMNRISGKELSDIDIIKRNSENSKMMNIDDILDKINQFGISSLSKEEKNYLDNYSNK